MTESHEKYISIGKNIPEAIKSQLFGKSCFKISGKPFMSFFENEIVFKLGAETHTEALSLDGAQLFDPTKKNRPMKEWVQVPFVYHKKWPAFAETAMRFVKRAY
jgi:hypothetical protein